MFGWKKKEYWFYVTYSFEDKNGGIGRGKMDIRLMNCKRIDTFETINKLMNYIEDQDGLKKVLLLDWKPMKK